MLTQLTAGSVAEVLDEAVRRATDDGRPVLATVAVATDLTMLDISGHATACWWSQPGFSMFGIGAAAEVVTSGDSRFRDLNAQLRVLFLDRVGDEPVAFAGGRFMPGSADDEWEGFEEACAWIPEVALIHDEAGARLVASVLVNGKDGDLRTRLENLLQAGAPTAPPAPLLASRSSTFTPDDGSFSASVEAALRDIADGKMHKAVLARRLRTETGASAADLIAALSLRYPDFYGYAAVRGTSAFVGASPELLVQTEGSTVTATPAAGTVAGTPFDAMNRKLAGGLDSVKSRWEQELVADTVYDVLEPLCESIHASLPMVVKAGPVQHLSTRVEGQLSGTVDVLELVAALHPTPAVGGVPTAEAITFIEEAEGFDRGWYSGPIGIVRSDGSGSFAVALRGALLHDGEMDLFAGAGIVEGSIPDDERQEVELKLSAVASLFEPRD